MSALRNSEMPIALAQKLSLVDRHWSPRIVAELNGQYVKVAKLMGRFVLHQHDDEDELFLVLKGTLTIELADDQKLVLREGELAVIPRGTPHRPVCDEEVQVLLFEPKSTTNTGNVQHELSVAAEWL